MQKTNNKDAFTPDPFTIKELAAKGWTLEMIGQQYDMYEADLENAFKAQAELKKAYDMGKAKFKATLSDRLTDTKDRGLLLLAARMHLKMDDPIMDKLAGNLLSDALNKTQKETKKTLANILGIQ